MGTGGVSGGDGGGVGVTVEEIEVVPCGSDKILAVPAIDSCSSLLGKKVMLATEAKQSQRKSSKVPRSSGASKRLRTAQVEVSLSRTVSNDVKEKAQGTKQTNALDGKRGDKRNGKVNKNKYDPFSLKNGLFSIGSAAGGSINLGMYGSNPEKFDATMHENEQLLNELLDGSFNCPNFTNNSKVKKAGDSSSVLHSVTKAFSVLRFSKPVQAQNTTEVGSGLEVNTLTCQTSSAASSAEKCDGDNEDTCGADPSLCDKDSGCKLVPEVVLDFALRHPKDILEQLALPMSKDLDSLLIDSTKAAAKNNSDARSCRALSQRVGLPPFPWSHPSTGHLKSGADVAKQNTNKSTCQGRWIKIGNTLTPDVTSRFLEDLESLAFDQSLIPPEVRESAISENRNISPSAVNLVTNSQALPSSTTRSTSQLPPATAEHSPTTLAAAQTLYEIATLRWKPNANGTLQQPKNPSQKPMNPCKLASREKSGKPLLALKSDLRPDNLVKCAGETLPLKKARFSVNEETDDLVPLNTTRKGLINWSTPRSSRLSPSGSSKDSVAETKNNNPSVSKRPSQMLSSSTRVVDKAGDNRPQKQQKVVSMEWNRTDYKLH